MFRFTFLAICLILVAIGCGTVSVTGFQNPVSCANVSATFAANVVPLFTSAGCTTSGCHIGGTPAGNLDLDAGGTAATIFANIGTANVVDTTTPKDSRILTKPLKGAVDHEGGDQFERIADPNYATLFCWVAAGAQNN